MIGKIAVSAAVFAIDKPYSYRVPEGMELLPGHRVQLPFGRANKMSEGIVLSVEAGDETGLKEVARVLDDAPMLTRRQLQLAAFCGSGISAPILTPPGPCSRQGRGSTPRSPFPSPPTAAGPPPPSARRGPGTF